MKRGNNFSYRRNILSTLVFLAAGYIAFSILEGKIYTILGIVFWICFLLGVITTSKNKEFIFK